MPLTKITGSDDHPMAAFVVTDLPDVPADGIVRSAKKILLDGARTMARSRTYSWAVLERRRSGASAGISVDPPHRDAALATFIEAVLPQVSDGSLSLTPGKGVTDQDLSALSAARPGGSLGTAPTANGTAADELLADSAVSSAAAALGDLEGRTVAIEGAGSCGPALAAALEARGARVLAVATTGGAVVGGPQGAELVDAWRAHGDALPSALGSELPATEVFSTDADVLMCGSRIGLVDHELAASLPVRAVVPVGPAPVTAKGLAVAARRDVLVVADFVSLAGSAAALDPGEDSLDGARRSLRERCESVTESAMSHPDGPYLGACAVAEVFLSTWQDELPFGRPLA